MHVPRLSHFPPKADIGINCDNDSIHNKSHLFLLWLLTNIS